MPAPAAIRDRNSGGSRGRDNEQGRREGGGGRKYPDGAVYSKCFDTGESYEDGDPTAASSRHQHRPARRDESSDSVDDGRICDLRNIGCHGSGSSPRCADASSGEGGVAGRKVRGSPDRPVRSTSAPRRDSSARQSETARGHGSGGGCRMSDVYTPLSGSAGAGGGRRGLTSYADNYMTATATAASGEELRGDGRVYVDPAPRYHHRRRGS